MCVFGSVCVGRGYALQRRENRECGSVFAILSVCVHVEEGIYGLRCRGPERGKESAKRE